MRSSVVVLAIVLGACGAEPDVTVSAPEPDKPRFEGLIVTGSPADARASGFTDCVSEGNGYYGFTCANVGASLLGAKPISTVVRLQYPSGLAYDAERLPERTSYSSITYQFPEAVGYESQGCQYVPNNPYACVPDQDQPLPALLRALKEQGWLGRSMRWGVEYVKPGQPFKVAIATRRVNADIDGDQQSVVEVNVYPASTEEVVEVVEMIQADQRKRLDTDQANSAFVESMAAD